MRPAIEPIDLIEAAAISFIISGVLWNVLAGYRLVNVEWLPPAITLTTVFLMALLLLETVSPTTAMGVEP